jgi:hypothetical protein
MAQRGAGEHCSDAGDDQGGVEQVAGEEPADGGCNGAVPERSGDGVGHP